jgi:hypothetical protein
MAVAPRPAPRLGPTSTPAQAGGAAAATPANATTLCCWCDKFEKQVSARRSDYLVSSQSADRPFTFGLTVDLVGNEVVITRVLKWGVVEPGITDAQKAKVRTGLTSGVPAIWSGKYRLKVTDATCNPTTKILTIRFRLRWEDANNPGNLTVNLKPGPGRSGATGFQLNMVMTDIGPDNYALAHEFGHTVGQADEYVYPNFTAPSVEYKRADGSVIRAMLPQSGNIMSTRGNLTFKPRFYYFIEIEAQKLLRSAQGLGKAGVTCEIV